MTHDVLQSDVELARKLRNEQCPDEEIIRALVHRGVEPGAAAQLMDDLRSGKKVIPKSPTPAEFAPRRRSRAEPSSSRTREDMPVRPSAAESPDRPLGRPARHHRERPRSPWLILAILAGLVLVALGLIFFLRGKPAAASPEEPESRPAAAKTPPLSLKAPAAAASASRNDSLSSPSLELQPDGLHIGGHLATQNNLLPIVTSLLGVPTRTNQVPQTGMVIYAFDQQGILIYSQPAGGTNSIVLDCEASGGVNGTTSPFAGLLKMENLAIGPDTDSATLSAIQELNLQRPSAGGSVWKGHYHSLELAFAYLRSPQHLSLIEIDLK